MAIKLPIENDILPIPSANEALKEVLRTRRSVKILDFDSTHGPNFDELHDILALANRVPDHGKIAPWRFIILQDEARQELGAKMADILKAKTHNMDENHYEMEKRRFLRAHSVVIMISSPNIHHPKVPVWEQELACGGLGFNITLAANAFGYIATWLSEWPMFDDDIKSLLKLYANERIAGFFYIGKTNKNPIERERKSVDNLIQVWK
ncbi:MAG: nitroreductase [Caulobacterales bacterium]|nr:nitroreductase [Caulobacterales bacterium]MCA0372700.1 nitroreductase [Pseudomonadota bacterium]